ncbi:MAG: riboflavin synthase [Desulfosarcinaceae bacterium]
MFTGIIEGLGIVTAVHPGGGQSLKLSISADFDLAGSRIGDSFAVNGACLTAVTLQGRRLTVDVSPETVSRTTLGLARKGDRVNLERALRLSDRLDGHLVSGHIDGQGRLEHRETLENAIVLTFSAPPELLRYMIEKGSVAIDGISLTINKVDGDGFQVSIIPHTARITTMGMKRIGGPVNLETDLIGKYVERFLSSGRGEPERPGGEITWELLAKSGFLK